jgi:hypothetical protein
MAFYAFKFFEIEEEISYILLWNDPWCEETQWTGKLFLSFRSKLELVGLFSIPSLYSVMELNWLLRINLYI